MKRPSFQFYPSDWLRDTALRTCSTGARGLWIDMICFMHEGNPYGHLKVGSKVILPSNLASMSGSTLEQVQGWLDELKDAGVYDVAEDGAIFSRRMIRDENLRNSRASGGKLGGNPALMDKQKVLDKVNHKVKQISTPSSSSSSSSSENIPLTPKGETLPGFAAFWLAWPANGRRQAKGKCFDAWKRASAENDSQAIIAHVERLKDSEDWRKNGGAYIPAPLTYLNQRRWEGAGEDAGPDPFAGAI